MRFKLKDYHKVWKKRADLLAKAKSRTEANAAKYMIARVRMRIPRKSGLLMRSLRRAGNLVAMSTGNRERGFPYALWVNQTAGFRTITFPNGVAFTTGDGKLVVLIRPGTQAVYGSRPRFWRWTGQARFWDKSVDDTRRMFPKTAQDTWADVFNLKYGR